MNADEVTRYITLAVAVISPVLVRWGVPQDTANTLIAGFINAIVPLLPAIGASMFAIWHGWNKRLVHETAIVTAVAPNVTLAKQASIIAGK